MISNNRIKYDVLEERSLEIFELASIKNYLRISHNYDDALIQLQLGAAIKQVELFLGIEITEKIIAAHIPSLKQRHVLNMTPIASIQQIDIGDKKGITLKDIGIIIDLADGLLEIRDKTYLNQSAKIVFNVGFGASLPSHLQHGLLQLLSSAYNNDHGFKRPPLQELFGMYRKVRV